MLVCVADMLQRDDFNDLFARYPSVKMHFTEPLWQSMVNETDELGRGVFSQAFSDALQYALELAKNRDPVKFARLTCKTFGPGECPLRRITLRMVQINIFTQGALSEICH